MWEPPWLESKSKNDAACSEVKRHELGSSILKSSHLAQGGPSRGPRVRSVCPSMPVLVVELEPPEAGLGAGLGAGLVVGAELAGATSVVLSGVVWLADADAPVQLTVALVELVPLVAFTVQLCASTVAFVLPAGLVVVVVVVFLGGGGGVSVELSARAWSAWAEASLGGAYVLREIWPFPSSNGRARAVPPMARRPTVTATPNLIFAIYPRASLLSTLPYV